MPKPDADRPSGTGVFASPHPNGSDRGAAPRRTLRRRLLLLGLAVFVGAWAFAIWFSVTRPTGEPLDDASTRAIGSACESAAQSLDALPPPGNDAERTSARIISEDEILTAMATSLRAVRPTDRDGRAALYGWLDDWDAVVASRDRYAHDLHTSGTARLSLPRATGTKPVTVRMAEYADAHGLGVCTPRALQVEVVAGERTYPATTGTRGTAD